jgi:deoxyribonuclease-2
MIAIKMPNGVEFRYIDSNNLQKWSVGQDMNDWFDRIYNKNNSVDGFIVYNDQISSLDSNNNSTKGHLKGILTWTNKKLTWLIHSIPEFPSSFDGNNISKINKSEYKFAQSCVFLTFSRFNENIDILPNVFSQIHNMKPNIYLSKNYDNQMNKKYICKNSMITLQINKSISHISKSHKLPIDIYEDYFGFMYGPCKTETWIRGDGVEETKNVKHIKKIKGIKQNYLETQDHSKFAVSNDGHHICISDLNRMNSQKKRGGGCLVLKDKKLWKLFNEIVIE